MLDQEAIRRELSRLNLEDGADSRPEFPELKDGDLCLWTDGSAIASSEGLGNPGGAAFAVTLVHHGKERYVTSYATHLSGYNGRNGVTVNYAELRAIKDGLNYLQKLEHAGRKTIHVFSDSSYAVLVLSQWAYTWEQEAIKADKTEWVCGDGWPVQNGRIIKSIHQFRAAFKYIVYHKIRGHRGYLFNEHVDSIAGIARLNQFTQCGVESYRYENQHARTISIDQDTNQIKLVEY